MNGQIEAAEVVKQEVWCGGVCEYGGVFKGTLYSIRIKAAVYQDTHNETLR
jgi:hypothetical protein